MTFLYLIYINQHQDQQIQVPVRGECLHLHCGPVLHEARRNNSLLSLCHIQQQNTGAPIDQTEQS